MPERVGDSGGLSREYGEQSTSWAICLGLKDPAVLAGQCPRGMWGLSLVPHPHSHTGGGQLAFLCWAKCESPASCVGRGMGNQTCPGPAW